MDQLTIRIDLQLSPPIWLDVICECERKGFHIVVNAIEDIREYHCRFSDTASELESEGWTLKQLDNWPHVRERWLREVRSSGYQEELWRQYRNLYGMTADQAAATNAERDWELQTGR